MAITRPIVVLGAGGHAKVLLDALYASNHQILGLTQRSTPGASETFEGLPIIGSDSAIDQFSADEIQLVIGVGSIAPSTTRANLFLQFKERGFTFATVIHPSAVISRSAVLGEGAQIMAGAVVQPGTTIGENSIVNTRASVDHDCKIGKHVHIGPGVTLSGGVVIGDGTHLGTGASVIQGITIQDGVMVAAGAVVVRDVPSRARVMGVPARAY